MHAIEQLGVACSMRVISDRLALVGQRRLACDQLVAFALEPLQHGLRIGDRDCRLLFGRFVAHNNHHSRRLPALPGAGPNVRRAMSGPT